MQLNARSDGPGRKANIEAPQRIRVDLEGFEFDFFIFISPLPYTRSSARCFERH
jgi:hypothetical protein